MKTPVLECLTLLVLATNLELSSAFQGPIIRSTLIEQNHLAETRLGQLHTGTSLSLYLGPVDELLQSAASTSPTTVPFSSTFSLPSSSSILLAEESWRQYVPLAVSVLVIIDILLGSPAANSVLGVIRAPPPDETSDDSEDEGTTAGEGPPAVVKTKGERVDSADVANEALEKARNALEWQQYKESTKTDTDRMEEIRRKMDDQLREMDSKKQD